MIDRRTFVGSVAGIFAVASIPGRSQTTARVYRIGFLASANPAATPRLRDTLRDALRERGFVEGQNLRIDYRWTDGVDERLVELASELVRLKADLLFAWGTPASLAAMRATSTLPIVFLGVADPVGSGLIASLAHPGGNVTGVSNLARDLAAKLVELLVGIAPGIVRFAVLRNSRNPSTEPQLREAEVAARRLGLQLLQVDIASPGDFDAAFFRMGRDRAMGLVVIPDPTFISHRQRIAELALQYRLPSIFARRENVEAGGLMAYGASLQDQVRHAAVYVDKILKGAKPADLPAEEPTKLELVINLKTAKALGLAIPQTMLLRADEVIQ